MQERVGPLAIAIASVVIKDEPMVAISQKIPEPPGPILALHMAIPPQVVCRDRLTPCRSKIRS